MNHFYRNVRGLGNVAVTRHAQDKCVLQGISQDMFDGALLNANAVDRKDGMEVLWREFNNVRLVILLKPKPDRQAKVVITVYKIGATASIRST